MTVAKSSDSSDLWLDRMDEVHSVIHQLANGTDQESKLALNKSEALIQQVQQSKVDQLTAAADSQAKQDAAKQALLDANAWAPLTGRPGKGSSAKQNYTYYCSVCNTEFGALANAKQCPKCNDSNADNNKRKHNNKPLLTYEERRAQLQSKVAELMHAKQQRRLRREMFASERAKAIEQANQTNTPLQLSHRVWDLYEAESDSDPETDAQFDQQTANDPRFAALEADIKSRAKQRQQAYDKAQVHRLAANIKVASKEWRDALELYTHALMHVKDDKSLYTNRALCELHCHLYSECCKDCTLALDIYHYLDDTKHENVTNKRLACKAYVRRARARMCLRQYTEALDDILKAHQLTVGTQQQQKVQQQEIQTLKSECEEAMAEAEEEMKLKSDISASSSDATAAAAAATLESASTPDGNTKSENQSAQSKSALTPIESVASDKSTKASSPFASLVDLVNRRISETTVANSPSVSWNAASIRPLIEQAKSAQHLMQAASESSVDSDAASTHQRLFRTSGALSSLVQVIDRCLSPSEVLSNTQLCTVLVCCFDTLNAATANSANKMACIDSDSHLLASILTIWRHASKQESVPYRPVARDDSKQPQKQVKSSTAMPLSEFESLLFASLQFIEQMTLHQHTRQKMQADIGAPNSTGSQLIHAASLLLAHSQATIRALACTCLSNLTFASIAASQALQSAPLLDDNCIAFSQLCALSSDSTHFAVQTAACNCLANLVTRAHWRRDALCMQQACDVVRNQYKLALNDCAQSTPATSQSIQSTHRVQLLSSMSALLLNLASPEPSRVDEAQTTITHVAASIDDLFALLNRLSDAVTTNCDRAGTGAASSPRDFRSVDQSSLLNLIERCCAVSARCFTASIQQVSEQQIDAAVLASLYACDSLLLIATSQANASRAPNSVSSSMDSTFSVDTSLGHIGRLLATLLLSTNAQHKSRAKSAMRQFKGHQESTINSDSKPQSADAPNGSSRLICALLSPQFASHATLHGNAALIVSALADDPSMLPQLVSCVAPLCCVMSRDTSAQGSAQSNAAIACAKLARNSDALRILRANRGIELMAALAASFSTIQ